MMPNADLETRLRDVEVELASHVAHCKERNKAMESKLDVVVTKVDRCFQELLSLQRSRERSRGSSSTLWLIGVVVLQIVGLIVTYLAR